MTKSKINIIRNLGGGCIGEVSLVEYNGARAVLKKYPRHPSMIHAEIRGLRLLASQNYLLVPEVLLENNDFFLMEYLEPSGAGDHYEFGRSLALMHKEIRNDYFGLDHDNFIGENPQFNKTHSEWWSFFLQQRLIPQLKIAGMLDRSHEMEAVCRRLLEGMNVVASLVHGDLWSGNILWSKKGAALIDPAVSWSHGEVDIAMTRLFGHQPGEFYQGYNSIHPPDDESEERETLYNLYHLLNHYNLFGNSYLPGVNGSMERLSRLI